MNNDIYLKVTFVAREFQDLKRNIDPDDILNCEKNIKLY